ncbi:MAG: polysaccharide lyase family 1 protein [Planctomycetota bacterium]
MNIGSCSRSLRRRGLWLAVLALGCVPGGLLGDERRVAFPGAEGFGAFARGGRGGDVYRVTTLEDSGPGSLRDGIATASGPRTVVFEVSGTIELGSPLVVRRPFLTIAGQTAPGDGIALKGWGLEIRGTHDVIVRFIRLRPGDAACKQGFHGDCLTVRDATDVMIDHVSMSWSVDEAVSIRGSDRITLQWCFITESLDASCHPDGPHSCGSLLGPNPHGALTIHHCLFAHHVRRSPKPTSSGGTMRFQFENNVVYDWRDIAGYTNTAEYGEDLLVRYVGNYVIAGPSTRVDPSSTIEGRGERGPAGIHEVAFRGESPDVRIYQAGNVIDSNRDKVRNGRDTGWGMFAGSYRRLETLADFPELRTSDAETACAEVLAGAGASRSRDAADRRLARQVGDQTGGIIDSPADVGGWPVLGPAPAPADADHDGMADEWERLHGLNPGNPADCNADIERNGSTALEKYIDSLVR